LLCRSAVQLRQALLDWLRRADLSPTAADWALGVLFALIYGEISALLTIPLQYYKDFVLPHRYDLSTQTRKVWLVDRLKELAVSDPLSLVRLELLYLALRLTGERWWRWAAVFLLLFNVLLSNLAPVLLLPLFNKFVPLAAEHAELVERLMRLANRSGARVRGVFQYDESRRRPFETHCGRCLSQSGRTSDLAEAGHRRLMARQSRMRHGSLSSVG
jgi:STE24 endopeptidase